MGAMKMPSSDKHNMVPIIVIDGKVYVELTSGMTHYECCEHKNDEYPDLKDCKYIPLEMARNMIKARFMSPFETAALSGPDVWGPPGTFGEGNKGRRNV